MTAVISCSGVSGAPRRRAGARRRRPRRRRAASGSRSSARTAPASRRCCATSPARCRGSGDPAPRRPGRRASSRRRERALLVALVPQQPVVPDGHARWSTTCCSVARRTSARSASRARTTSRPSHDALGAPRPAWSSPTAWSPRCPAASASGCSSPGRSRRAPPIVLLDEPTTALDVGHQQQVLELVDDLRRRPRPHRASAPCTTSRWPASTPSGSCCSTAAGVAVEGPPDEVLTEEHLARHYGARVRIVHDGDRPVVLPIRAGAP